MKLQGKFLIICSTTDLLYHKGIYSFSDKNIRIAYFSPPKKIIKSNKGIEIISVLLNTLIAYYVQSTTPCVRETGLYHHPQQLTF